MVSVEERSPDEKIIRLQRCIQLYDLKEYDPVVDRLLEESHRLITVDLGDLNTINILTIEKILLLEQELWQRGRSLRIRGCSLTVYSAFQYLKLDRFLHITRP